MVSPFHSLATQIHMSVWGERDAAGNDGVRIVPHDGPGFVIPVVIEHEPKFEAIEGHNIDNPVKMASFCAQDWWANVPCRDPAAGDVLIMPDRKKWDMGPTSMTNDGRFEVPLYEFQPR
jgi:hypothetical protein